MSTTGDPFSVRLRQATWSEHQAAESERYVSALIAGDLDRADYATLVAQHHAIYRALETVADELRDHPVVGRFVDDRLTRLPALDADLEFLAGPDWADHLPTNPTTLAYAARIRTVGASWPAGFVAHHYTRYLGDLSGGLAIGRALSRTYRLGDGPGATFYRFAGIPDPRAYKQAYRERLDALPLDEGQRVAVVDEVRVAYRCNIAVLSELGRATGRAGEVAA
ncbi:biliverdin-producing heme oxygenase [Micromonospora sp. NBC_01699]|uniref:biliverdin-producing heme oxygenase n=1 Tax=Micromonospora sp. NBC_01699 TaxID=2975984 RepID=UPI002E378185|nr:biliverdin-producing heme oxygenase [Micromonospora sp. NBC_01699]